MIPNIEIFGKTISFYMIMALTGVLVFVFFSQRMAKKDGLDEIPMLFLALISLASSLIGSHLLYGITMFPYLRYLVSHWSELIKSFADFYEWMKVIFGGAVYFGGLLTGLLGGYIYYRKKKLSVRYVDISACVIPLFHFFGRLGCFFSGCCYGIECDFGVVYHYHPDPSVNGIRRFPVQLMEALFNLLLFFLLYYMFRHKKQTGRLMLWYLIAYPVFRFCDEFLRGDDIRGFVGPLSTSQIAAILILSVTVPYAVISYIKRKKVNPDTVK